MILLRTLSWLIILLSAFADASNPNESLVEEAPPPTPQRDSAKQIYRPPVAAKFQIILNRGDGGRRASADALNTEAEILDLDLFDTSADTIRRLHAKGKKVLCYFSAGSSESWRKDLSKLESKDKGDTLRGWNRENWLDLRSQNVWSIMQARIALAAEKNCDGIDPDNIDSFGDEVKPGGGFNPPLTRQDSIDFIRKLSAEAHSRGLAVGLKNAEAILPQVGRDVEFAVNEQCATYYGGCSAYSSFLASGKPVFHIEYATPAKGGNDTHVALRADSDALYGVASDKLQRIYCLQEGLGNRRWLSVDIGRKFSTVIKEMNLGSWAVYCDSAVASGVVGAPQDGSKSEAPISTGRPRDNAGWEGLFSPKNKGRPNQAGDRESGRDSSRPSFATTVIPVATQIPQPAREIPKGFADWFRPKATKPQETTAVQEQDGSRGNKGWEDWSKPRASKPENTVTGQTDEIPRLPKGWEEWLKPKQTKPDNAAPVQADNSLKNTKGWEDWSKSIPTIPTKPDNAAGGQAENSPKNPKGWEDWSKPKSEKPETPTSTQDEESPRFPRGWLGLLGAKILKSQETIAAEINNKPKVPKEWSDFFSRYSKPSFDEE